MGKSCGINPNIAMWMYKTVLLPQILYASVVLWCVVSRVEAKNLQQSLQGSYLRTPVGSVKATPTEALEVALCLTPLDLAVIGAARFTAYRLSCQGEWRNTVLGHMKLQFLQKYPFTLKQNRILKKISFVKQYKVLILTRDVRCMPGKTADPNIDIWYTGGSGISSCFGAVVCGPRVNHRENIHMGCLSAVLQTAVMAILRLRRTPLV